MPTTYTDQFFVLDPANPPGFGTVINPITAQFIDNNDDGLIRAGFGDTWEGNTITAVWLNDTITVRIGGVNQTINGVTFYVSGQPAVFTPTDGTVLETATFVRSTFVTQNTQVDVGDFGPVCFTPGTLIDTPRGRVRVEDLAVGDLVETRDHGAQPIRYISVEDARAHDVFAPVWFAPGVLGNSEAILVSQQHRMLVTGWRAELLFGQDEVLVAAKHLVDGVDVQLRPGGMVRYIHLLFDAHEIVTAAGCPSESYFPGHATDRAGPGAEIAALFPDLAAVAGGMQAARRVLKHHEGRLLAA